MAGKKFPLPSDPQLNSDVAKLIDTKLRELLGSTKFEGLAPSCEVVDNSFVIRWKPIVN